MAKKKTKKAKKDEPFDLNQLADKVSRLAGLQRWYLGEYEE
jgi:hypothetical protein